ncbi:MAG: ComEC/Rec2 family competence protein [Eubacterium sp.]
MNKYKIIFKLQTTCILLIFFMIVFILSGCVAQQTTSDSSTNTGGYFEIHAIDVGQADAYLVIGNRGSTALIDCGNIGDFKTIDQYLKKAKVTKLDYFFLSHAHEDHAGCADKIIQNYTVEQILISEKPSSAKFYQRFLMAVKDKGKKVAVPKANHQFELDDGVFTILGPVETYEDMNNASLVFRLDYQKNSMLFTGDAEYKNRSDLLKTRANLDVDVLKASHHGANNGVFDSEKNDKSNWLDAVSPEAVIFSVGSDNDYGHPDKKALEWYQREASSVYRTDMNGSIIIRFSGQDIWINSER